LKKNCTKFFSAAKYKNKYCYVCVTHVRLYAARTLQHGIRGNKLIRVW